MSQLRIAFRDFPVGIDVRDNMLTRILIESCDACIVDQLDHADCVVYSDFGDAHRAFQGRTLYFSGENALPDFDACDFAITSAYIDDPRHFRLPYYAFSCRDPHQLVLPIDWNARDAIRAKTGFCSFMASNPRAPERNRCFRLLHRAIPIDSGGKHFNTTGERVRDKHAFLSARRFNLCFENTSSAGYTTEKLIDAYLARTIPIYWGNPRVGEEFNRKSMIYAGDFPSIDALAQHVLEIATDDARCAEILAQPPLLGNTVGPIFFATGLSEALQKFFSTPHVQRTRSPRKRRLREHCYESPWQQTLVSLQCRLDGLAWKWGWRQ